MPQSILFPELWSVRRKKSNRDSTFGLCIDSAVAPLNGTEFEKFYLAEITRWAPLMKASGARVDRGMDAIVAAGY